MFYQKSIPRGLFSLLKEERERERERERASEWFIEKGHGAMSVVVMNIVKQL